jgi:outer membrane protein assembly factor BamA
MHLKILALLSRLVLCGALALAPSGLAAAETGKTAVKEAKKDELLLPAVPVVGYSRETNFLFGAMMVRALRWKDAPAAQRPNTIALSGFFSLENQWAVGLAPSFYFRGEEYLVKSQLYYHRTPARFWGIGTEAGEHGNREDFTATGTGLTLSAMKKVYRSLRVGPGIWYGSSKIPKKDDGGLLETDAVTGSNGGRDVGVELLADWDGRDNIYAPSTGTFVQFWAGLHRDFLGSEFDYEDYMLDVRRFFPLGSGQVLALQAKGRIMAGDPPFYRLANIGGIGVLRGLYEGRFRDKTAAAVQAEYRFPIPLWKPLGGVIFAGVGEVAERPADLSLEDLRFAAGAGARITLDPKERINLRIDVGFSSQGVYPILVITEAF